MNSETMDYSFAMLRTHLKLRLQMVLEHLLLNTITQLPSPLPHLSHTYTHRLRTV